MDSYIIMSAATSFAAFIGCLIGYHIREKRHNASIADIRGHWKSISEDTAKTAREYRREFESEQALGLELQKTIESLGVDLDNAAGVAERWEAAYEQLKAEFQRVQKELQPYADAMWHAIVVNHLPGHGSAQEQLDRIINLEVQIALDPAVSKPAKNLIIRAKREHGKKLRARHEREMQVLRDKARGYEELHNMAEEECVKLQQTLDLRRSALLNTTRDKLRLNGVRTAFIHAYWEEVARLRTVVKQTEETK